MIRLQRVNYVTVNWRSGSDLAWLEVRPIYLNGQASWYWAKVGWIVVSNRLQESITLQAIVSGQTTDRKSDGCCHRCNLAQRRNYQTHKIMIDAASKELNNNLNDKHNQKDQILEIFYKISSDWNNCSSKDNGYSKYNH